MTIDSTIVILVSFIGVLMLTGNIIFFSSFIYCNMTEYKKYTYYTISIILILVAPLYFTIKSTYDNLIYNSFSVDIADIYEELDYDKLYEDILLKSKADEVSAYFYNDVFLSNFTLVFDENSKIKNAELKIVVQKNNKFILYDGKMANGKLYFKAKEYTIGAFDQYYKLSIYFDRIKKIDSMMIDEYVNNQSQGSVIEFCFNYYTNERIRIDNSLYETIAIDKDNKIINNNEVTARGYSIDIYFSYLKETKYIPVLIMDGKYYENKRTKLLRVLNWVG
jgi:hypothetical protein